MPVDADVFEYDSVDDLEATIDEVYEATEQLNDYMETLLDQADAFLDYRHDPETFSEAADYVASNIPDEALPGIVRRYAQQELDEPEQASNWERLEQADTTTDELVEQWQGTYKECWAAFGFEDERLRDEIQGLDPFKHLLRTWENHPYHLFEDQETYDDRTIGRASLLAHTGEPTMARFFDIEHPTSKQRDDMMRAVQLEKDEKRDRELPFRNDDWAREFLSGQLRDRRWVDRSEL
ncbi:MAG: hypothetical protein SV186_01630 [Candidatus Nanohaloarchaea archaeon]|nr:hypothetical protein [Candidatus Nanohaloarchaea archaeon]